MSFKWRADNVHDTSMIEGVVRRVGIPKCGLSGSE